MRNFVCTLHQIADPVLETSSIANLYEKSLLFLFLSFCCLANFFVKYKSFKVPWGFFGPYGCPAGFLRAFLRTPLLWWTLGSLGFLFSMSFVLIVLKTILLNKEKIYQFNLLHKPPTRYHTLIFRIFNFANIKIQEMKHWFNPILHGGGVTLCMDK